jgi:hypothetical protein
MLHRERRFAEAQAQYEAALKFRKGGRAEPLARYARALAQGDAAVQRRDWPAATAAYDDAVRTGMDTGGYAASQLDRVRLRPFAIRLRSAVVKPFRPDGSPWAGRRGSSFDRLVGRLATKALDRQSDGGRDALDVYDSLPHENRPNLFATLTLPDGRQYVTPAHKAIYARFESSVVLATNSYDDRPVTIRIAHAGSEGQTEVGAVTVRVSDLLNGGEVALRDRGIVQLKLAAHPSPLADGACEGFSPVPVAPPPPPPGPAPRR